MTRSACVRAWLAITLGVLGAGAPVSVASQSTQGEPARQRIEIGPGDPSFGPATAPVTIVEFADFECPFCRRVTPTLKQVRARYGDLVRVVWKDYPLTRIHPHAFQAAVAGRCAFAQDRFWEYHDRLFGTLLVLDASALQRYADRVGLDVPRFTACLGSPEASDEVRRAIGEAIRLGLTGTPSTFVNGRLIKGAKPFAAFASIVDDELQRLRPPTR